jgi:2-polyprenyl-3-methyl-5-hydroxy-6-metoxy-1,4-benzoquinol methylase
VTVTTHADRFNERFAVRLKSAAWERVYRTAFGDDYPEGTHTAGFYSRATLQRLCAALRLAPGKTLVDLGCGHGGPGLWVAEQTGASLIGIDLSAVGVALAVEQAQHLGLAERARFQVGDITATGLPDACCDAVLSLDVLLFVPDKAAAIRECARILRAGGMLGFSTWEQSGYSARLGAEQLADHRPLLEANGFVIEAYEEPEGWQRQHRALAEGLIAAEADMAKDMAAATAAELAAMGRGVLADIPVRRYIRVVARKR